eukprot:193468_1
MYALMYIVLVVATHCRAQCDFYSNKSYALLSYTKIIDSIMIKKNIFRIKFDVKLNSYCNSTLCNILYIGDKTDIEFLSLNINGDYNYFSRKNIRSYIYGIKCKCYTIH